MDVKFCTETAVTEYVRFLLVVALHKLGSLRGVTRRGEESPVGRYKSELKSVAKLTSLAE